MKWEIHSLIIVKIYILLKQNEVVDPNRIQFLYSAEDVGQTKFHEYYNSRFFGCIEAVTNTIQKNKFSLFGKNMSRKDLPKHKEKLKAAKANISLFSRLFIACQTRDGDIETFFEHENQTFPPSLSENGTIRPVNQKSDILVFILEDILHSVIESPVVDAKVFDGGAISPRESRMFSDYANRYCCHLLKCTSPKQTDWTSYGIVTSQIV